MNRKILLTIINTFYFGFWFLLIYKMDLSAWWILFPVIVHWRMSDFI